METNHCNKPTGLEDITLSLHIPKFNLPYYTVLNNRIRKVHIDAVRLQIDEEDSMDDAPEEDAYWTDVRAIKIHLYIHEDGYSDGSLEHNWFKLNELTLCKSVKELTKALEKEYKEAIS